MSTIPHINLEEVDWKPVIIQLTAFAHNVIRAKTWFRGNNALPKGYKVEDFVMETIVKFLEEPEKFNADKNDDLLSFLKFYILRRLVYNLSVSSDNRENIDIEKKINIIATFIYGENPIECKMDFEKVVPEIEREIALDSDLENIFFLLYYEGKKRKEIYNSLAMTDKEYDNHVRRLRTVVKRVLKKHK